MNYKPLGHDVRHPFGCWCYRCIRKEVARLQGEWDLLRDALDGIKRRTDHADLPIYRDVNERAREALEE